MPDLSFPREVPIQRADWNTGFNAGGLLAPANNDRTPVNPIDVANQQSVMQSQNALRSAQAINAAQDAQQKQRAFQLSMLNGVMALPPEQQQDALQKVVPMMNRMGPTQFDGDMSPAMARMYMMANVPTEQVPQYEMMQGQAGLLNALRDRLSGNGQQQTSQQQTGMSPGQPIQQGGANPVLPQGTPMPANGIINGGSVPVPSGGGQPIDPQTLELMAAVKPDMANAMVGVQKLQYDSPQGQAAIAQSKKQGENAAAAQKGAVESSEGYNQVQQTIEALKQLAQDKDLPQSRMFVPSDYQAKISQNLGGTEIGKAFGIPNQNAANAYNAFSKINESQTINAIRDLAETGQIRMTRTLENIVNRGYLIDPDASAESKVQQANAIETELRNSMVAAQNVNARMNGGQMQPYTSPLQPPPGAAPQNPQAAPANAKEHFDSIANAKAAIAKGAPAAMVRQRLLSVGIDPALAGL